MLVKPAKPIQSLPQDALDIGRAGIRKLSPNASTHAVAGLTEQLSPPSHLLGSRSSASPPHAFAVDGVSESCDLRIHPEL